MKVLGIENSAVVAAVNAANVEAAVAPFGVLGHFAVLVAETVETDFDGDTSAAVLLAMYQDFVPNFDSQ